jgi:amidase
MKELLELDAVAQAELVKKRAVSALELVEAAIQRAEALEPKLGFVATPLYDEARSAARGAGTDAPLAGVPFVVKDLCASVAGARHTECSRLLENHVATADSELVRRFKSAGLIVIATAKASELGLMPHADSALFGRCKNPWDTSRSTGGSSGGSAAGVAANVVAIGHANDMGGSIRIPASCCGLFGMKPTRGRTPLGPDFGDIASGLVHQHAVTRSVRDSALLLDLIAGPAPGDPYAAPATARSFESELSQPPGKLRIAFSREPLNGAPVHADCVAAVEDAAKLCAELGHEVVEDAPSIPEFDVVGNAYVTLFVAYAASMIDHLGRVAGRAPVRELIEPHTFAAAELGRANTSADYLGAVATLQRFSRKVAEFLTDYAVWLTPTLTEPPLALGALDADPASPLLALFQAGAFVAFTWPANATGQPAMSVPLYVNAAGLPIGVQFAGRFGDEATLFRLAAELEQARPWTARKAKL